jgi:hypothetical protein
MATGPVERQSGNRCQVLDLSPLAAQQSSFVFEVIMLAYVFVLLAVAARIPSLMPHAWNFSPVAAALLYFGARGSRRQMWIPVALLALSDLLLDKYVYAYAFSWDLLLTWSWYGAMILLGGGLRQKTTVLRVGGAALAASVSFFLISNFGVWAAGTMYPKTATGLMTCYAAGVPFFRNTVEGDLLYSAAIFGLPVAAAAIARWMGKAQGTASAT